MTLNLHGCGATPFRRATFVFLLTIAGCSDSLQWTEEVRLPDGRLVNLSRYQEFNGPHELGQKPTLTDYWFEFKHPETGEVVRWQSDRDLRTLALIIERSIPYLLTRPSFGSSMYRYRCPNPPYLLYRYNNKSWNQIPIDQIPIKHLRINMTFDPSRDREKIENSKMHLAVKMTQELTYNYQPYVVDFSRMTQQTFELENCSKKLDNLIDERRS